ncbi:hypothetical protein LSAT2_015137, partial [Lamellibrachia satsuma]
MIPDKIVFSIAPQEKALKERLLRQENLTLTKTRDLCVAFEVTQNEVRSMSTHDTQSTTEKTVNYVKRRRGKQNTKSTPFSQRSNQGYSSSKNGHRAAISANKHQLCRRC